MIFPLFQKWIFKAFKRKYLLLKQQEKIRLIQSQSYANQHFSENVDGRRIFYLNFLSLKFIIYYLAFLGSSNSTILEIVTGI